MVTPAHRPAAASSARLILGDRLVRIVLVVRSLHVMVMVYVSRGLTIRGNVYALQATEEQTAPCDAQVLKILHVMAVVSVHQMRHVPAPVGMQD